MPLVIPVIHSQITVIVLFSRTVLEFCPIMGYTVVVCLRWYEKSASSSAQCMYRILNALGIGFYHASVNNQFDMAAWMVLWGVLLDKLDGTFARF